MDTRKVLNLRFSKLLISITCVATAALAGAEPSVRVNGQVQYSFRPGHYVLVNERGTLHLKNDELNLVQREKLEAAMAATRQISIEVPLKSVEYFSQPDRQEPGSLAESTDRRLEGLWFLDPVRARVEGISWLSWDDQFYLVQAGRKTYQLRKSMLTPAQMRKVESAGVGGHVSLELPLRAVELAWSLPGPDREVLVANREEDGIELNMNVLKISGTVLLAWPATKAMVQAHETIVRFDRTGVPEATNKLLDLPGARVKVEIPLASVEAMWSTGSGDRAVHTSRGGMLP